MHTDKRSVVGQGIYGKTKGGNLLTGKKSNKKFVNSIAEAQEVEEGIFDIFTNKDTKKSKKVAVSTDDEEGKISFSDLGKNAMFDPNDKRVTDDQRIFYEFILSQKNKADLTDFINVINHYIKKYKEALRKEGGSNPLNSGRLKVLTYFERQLEKMPIKESDISEEMLAKRLAQDFKSFKHPKDRGISQRAKDRDILPRQELDEYSWDEFKQDAADTGRGVAQGVTFGTGENIAAAAKSAFGPTTYKQELEKEKAANAAAKERSPYLYGGGELAGSILTPVPGGLVAGSLIKGASTAAKVGRGATSLGTNLATSYAVGKGKEAHDTSVLGKPAETPAQAAPAPGPTKNKFLPPSSVQRAAADTAKPAQAAAPSNFKQAFAAARKGGAGTFTYNGKEYNTQLAEQAMTKMKKIKPTIKQDKLTPHEKFKGSVKRAGYDMDAGANRLLKLLDKQAKERSERDSEDVNEWISRREEFNPQPAVSTFESADNVKTFRVTLVDRLTDEPKTVTVKASSNEEAESKAEKQHSGYDVRGSRKIAEGAKADRMVKHVEKSERAAGKSKKEAENIAWATANKRGMLDNKNKKKHVNEGRVKDIAMAIDELTHDGKTPGQIAKELDIPLMIVLKFKAQMDKMDNPVVAKGQLNEFDPGEERKGPFTLLAGDHHNAYEIGKFDSVEEAQEEVEFLMDADPKSARQQVFTILDRYEIKVWEQDPADAIDHMRKANKIQFLKPGKKDVDEAANPAQQAAIAINMKKHHQKPKNESYNSDEYDDESGMAYNQLKTIARSVKGLMNTIDDGDNLPEWVQKKLALAEDHLVTIWDYLQSEKSDEVMEARNGDTNFGSTVTHGSWVVYDGDKVKRFKSRDGAKAYAEKTGGKVASSEFYADNIQGKQGVAEGLEDNGISFKVQKGKNKFATTLSVGSNPVGVYQYDATTGRSIAEVYPEFKGKGLGKLLVLHAIYTAAELGLDFQEDESRTSEYDNVLDSLSSNGYIVDDDGYWYVTGEGEQYLQQSMKQGVAEAQQCPECGGAAYDNEILAEKQDACYSKVKSRYKVWPSAYASGALVKCRKVGAKNWGNKSKK
jgi:GNAT superfamily N-acetyltransferase